MGDSVCIYNGNLFSRAANLEKATVDQACRPESTFRIEEDGYTARTYEHYRLVSSNRSVVEDTKQEIYLSAGENIFVLKSELGKVLLFAKAARILLIDSNPVGRAPQIVARRSVPEGHMVMLWVSDIYNRTASRKLAKSRVNVSKFAFVKRADEPPVETIVDGKRVRFLAVSCTDFNGSCVVRQESAASDFRINETFLRSLDYVKLDDGHVYGLVESFKSNTLKACEETLRKGEEYGFSEEISNGFTLKIEQRITIESELPVGTALRSVKFKATTDIPVSGYITAYHLNLPRPQDFSVVIRLECTENPESVDKVKELFFISKAGERTNIIVKSKGIDGIYEVDRNNIFLVNYLTFLDSNVVRFLHAFTSLNKYFIQLNDPSIRETERK